MARLNLIEFNDLNEDQQKYVLGELPRIGNDAKPDDFRYKVNEKGEVTGIIGHIPMFSI